VHRAALAAEARAKFLKNPISLNEHAPEPICVLVIIGAMLFVAIKRDWILNLVGHGVDAHR
jgi:hypothetical protein